MDYRYPFGRPLRAVLPNAAGQRRIFVLGSYPSALHVHWTPPPGLDVGPVQALAVADEPEPFWTGADEQEQVAAWLRSVHAQPEWGLVRPAGRFNGSSGRHIDKQYLGPMGASRGDVWVSDIVNTYFSSSNGAVAIASRYEPVAAALDLPRAQLPARPSTEALIRLAVEQHRDRLIGELEEAEPEHVLTIGNEPLAALWEVGVAPMRVEARLGRLSVAAYGRRIPVRLPNGHACLLHPLAHPNLLFNPHRGADVGVTAGVAAMRSAHTRWAEQAAQDRGR